MRFRITEVRRQAVHLVLDMEPHACHIRTCFLQKCAFIIVQQLANDYFRTVAVVQSLRRCQHGASTTPHGPRRQRDHQKAYRSRCPHRARSNRYGGIQKSKPCKTCGSFWHLASRTQGPQQCGRRNGNNIFQDILQQERLTEEPIRRYTSTPRSAAAWQESGSWRGPHGQIKNGQSHG